MDVISYMGLDYHRRFLYHNNKDMFLDLRTGTSNLGLILCDGYLTRSRNENEKQESRGTIESLGRNSINGGVIHGCREENRA